MADLEKIDQILQFALAAAAREDDFRDRELGPIHLIKYAYLGDLAFAKAHTGTTFTGAAWRFHHFGPWEPSIFERIDPAVQAIEATKRVVPSPRYDSDIVRYRAATDEHRFDQLEQRLPWEVSREIRWAIHEFGNDTARLLRHVYLTQPMLHAAPGETLDFATALEERAKNADFIAAAFLPAPTKKQREKLRALREQVRNRLVERRAARSLEMSPPPRYDNVFAEGVAWLDSLAGAQAEATEGELVVSSDLWKSATRRESDVP